ncbi:MULTISPECIES: hypothetical protein [unclassified Lactobacillus]|uniref:hypothetical protein n=1 Tax=unclassified Lactobacillus TaxID=2620435 RepID=UPI000EFB97BE|nr:MULTISPECIES: hypothetical protein [unclassified Lactobacillus]RMC38137.1 hypothetical protein F5ESL0237_07820 [Lactobacillus sp. ESL0237]RMC42652.1 hypothetical protein F5ESL0234_07635 [Lactobacillus sp. ESL0234]RMC43365.1 hypothetical protein F5ESL0236_07845 [Lactobacillus sp. ESL0236]RMC47865.1 hypothetical protein F5ESL0225_07995 [Lactobacillus sp. ESL0225]
MRKSGTTQKRRRYVKKISINQLFEKIVKVKMFGKIWINGQDGNFYQIEENQEIVVSERHKYIGIVQPLNFVYQNMQAGYDLQGNPVCYRKNVYSKKRESLVWCRRFKKEP